MRTYSSSLTPIACKPVFPVVVDVPISKRLKLVGSGGHRIRALSAELGVQITSTGDETMSVFAPSREAMDVAVESISQLLNTDDGVCDDGTCMNGDIVLQ